MPDVSLATMALRLAISMGVVVALMLLAAKLLRRAQAYALGSAAGGRRQAKVTRIPIAVSSIAPVARGASVAIVRAAGRELVIGVTEHQVTLLHSAIETADAVETAAAIDAEGFTDTPKTADLDLAGLDLAGMDLAGLDLAGTDMAGLDQADAELSEDPFAGHIDLDTPQAPPRATSTSAARIAALVPDSSRTKGTEAGSSAWTDALETLRARTVRR